jgi:hypothetical protein
MLRHLISTTTVVVALVVASPALAARHRADPNHKISHSSSTNWSGYAVSGNGPYTSVSSSWTQPAVNCAGTANAWSSFWVGLDGDTTNTVEQTGTEADCSYGQPVYSAWYEMYPRFPVNFSNPVYPGDTFKASVTYVGSQSFRLTLSDTTPTAPTHQWSQTVTARLKSAKLGSAEVIAEAPSGSGGVLPLANFGTVNFGATMVNGVPLTSLSGIDPITMVTSGGIVKAKLGPLSSTGFSDTWKSQ